jgi:hypothetical protein
MAKILEARKIVLDFLKDVTSSNEINITKIVRVNSDKIAWEAEAVVFVPNQAIKALGIPTEREVMDAQTFLVRFDNEFEVIAYGLKNSLEE